MLNVMSLQGTNPPGRVFEKGTLLSTLRRVAAQAERDGALLSIPTHEAWVPDGGLELLVRVISSLARKDEERRRQAGLGDPTGPALPWTHDQGGERPERPPLEGQPLEGLPSEGSPSPGQARQNPFVPYEKALYVADVSDTHVAVLNKFNVVPEHLLIITRAFVHQSQILGPTDFHALFRCLEEYDALGFYNGGLLAGASQPHKHLQVVPLPLSPRGPSVPLGPALEEAALKPDVQAVPGLPFRHGFCRLDGRDSGDPVVAAREAEEAYRALTAHLGLRVDPCGLVADPYNLLCTRQWMLMVPRILECFEGISLNSLAFVGAFLVRDVPQMERLRKAGPLRALVQVAGPADPD